MRGVSPHERRNPGSAGRGAAAAGGERCGSESLQVAAALREEGRLLGDTEVLGVVNALRSELVGTGPLEPLLAAPEVTDVLVTAPDEVWVDRGAGLERTAVTFADAAAVRRLAQRLAAVAGRRLDDARPWVDARLPDGTRLHAVLPPVAVGSTCLSLRVVRPRAFSLAELVAAGTVPPGGAELLRAMLDARLSYLVSGGTGSGKTTLLSTLLGLVGREERIVLAEDSAELRPDHPHVVRLETRPANQEGRGQVTLRDLVRQALRMRPDRLVVGEVRGPEVTDLLGALNTGHEGGCGTVHANTAGDVPARLEALGSTAGLDRAALHSQLAAALSV
ncbi:type II/IV secretion system protein, partial [Streptomyces himastatinicus ATCC 53653]